MEIGFVNFDLNIFLNRNLRKQNNLPHRNGSVLVSLVLVLDLLFVPVVLARGQPDRVRWVA